MAKRKNQKRPPEAASKAAPAARRLSPTMLAAGAVGLVLLVAAVAGGALLLTSGGGPETNAELHAGKSAVIVDQLQLTAPNPDFVSHARETLSQAGYTVDYVAGEQVTVDLYRTLPSKGYDLVILRVHAGITTEVDATTGERTGTEYVSLFTGEPYDETKYSEEHLNRLGRARYNEDDDTPKFGIGPAFIEDSMEGDFGGALVLMMGCDGLRSQKTAEAFLDRGAGAFVSWTKPVSAPHTDEATEKLLQSVLVDGVPLEQAVQQIAAEVGPDPAYDGELRVLTG